MEFKILLCTDFLNSHLAFLLINQRIRRNLISNSNLINSLLKITYSTLEQIHINRQPFLIKELLDNCFPVLNPRIFVNNLSKLIFKYITCRSSYLSLYIIYRIVTFALHGYISGSVQLLVNFVSYLSYFILYSVSIVFYGPGIDFAFTFSFLIQKTYSTTWLFGFFKIMK